MVLQIEYLERDIGPYHVFRLLIQTFPYSPDPRKISFADNSSIDSSPYPVNTSYDKSQASCQGSEQPISQSV
jgi:hypothetical protein